MGDEQPGRKASHLRLAYADASAEEPVPSRPGAPGGGPDFLLAEGFAVCAACGTALAGHRHGEARRYMCDTSRGGCGAVRVSAASLETRVAGRLLALMAAPPTWERLAELGATGGREPVTARALVQWWDSAVHSDQQALIGLLLDHVRVTPVPGEELGLLDADRLAFVWA